MVSYICKLLDCTGNVLRIVPFSADDDRRASDHAILLQLTTPDAAGFQLCDRLRVVMAFQNTRPAWRSRRHVQSPSGRRRTVVPLRS